MKPLRVDLHFRTSSPYQFGVYHRCKDAFEKRAIKLRFFPDALPDPGSDADLFIVQESFPRERLQKLHRPIILEEKYDASMPRSRWFFDLPDPLLFFKISVIQKDYINLPSRRVHLWMLEEQGNQCDMRILSGEEIAKIRPGIHFGMFGRLERRVMRARHRKSDNDWKKRPIDALFIGRTDFPVATLARHRLKFCETLNSIRDLNIVCTPHRALNGREYLKLTVQSKVIVSPWGYGELCHRDFEALLDDCVLIKPRTEFIRNVGDVLQEGETYEPCRPDASDVEQVIRSVLANEKYSDPLLRRRNREQTIFWWSPETIADWWRAEIDQVLHYPAGGTQPVCP